MTELQKKLIDQKNEAELRHQISILTTGKHDDLIKYCEERLDALNTSSAIAENGEIKVGEV